MNLRMAQCHDNRVPCLKLRDIIRVPVISGTRPGTRISDDMIVSLIVCPYRVPELFPLAARIILEYSGTRFQGHEIPEIVPCYWIMFLNVSLTWVVTIMPESAWLPWYHLLTFWFSGTQHDCVPQQIVSCPQMFQNLPKCWTQSVPCPLSCLWNRRTHFLKNVSLNFIQGHDPRTRHDHVPDKSMTAAELNNRGFIQKYRTFFLWFCSCQEILLKNWG